MFDCQAQNAGPSGMTKLQYTIISQYSVIDFMKKCINVLNNPERQEIYEYGEIQH